MYLFLHIFKIRAEHLYKNGYSSCLDHDPGLVGRTWSDVGQHPCSLKLTRKNKDIFCLIFMCNTVQMPSTK